ATRSQRPSLIARCGRKIRHSRFAFVGTALVTGGRPRVSTCGTLVVGQVVGAPRPPIHGWREPSSAGRGGTDRVEIDDREKHPTGGDRRSGDRRWPVGPGDRLLPPPHSSLPRSARRAGATGGRVAPYVGIPSPLLARPLQLAARVDHGGGAGLLPDAGGSHQLPQPVRGAVRASREAARSGDGG